MGATPATLSDARCVGGRAVPVFGQTSYCNGVSFFAAVRQAEQKGLLKVRSCPVISNFEVAGLDPGEGVTTTYLLNPLTGQTAQDNSTDRGYVAGSTLLHGSSANAVLDQ